MLLRDDDKIRNHWPRGIVSQTFPDSGGLVRSVAVRVGSSKDLLTRPIAKLVLLVEADELIDSTSN